MLRNGLDGIIWRSKTATFAARVIRRRVLARKRRKRDGALTCFWCCEGSLYPRRGGYGLRGQTYEHTWNDSHHLARCSRTLAIPVYIRTCVYRATPVKRTVTPTLDLARAIAHCRRIFTGEPSLTPNRFLRPPGATFSPLHGAPSSSLDVSQTEITRGVTRVADITQNSQKQQSRISEA